MRTTHQMSITLPLDMADMVRARVKSGEYASESEVIRDGLRTLIARDRVIDDWLRVQVGAAYDSLKADPSGAMTINQVRAQLLTAAGQGASLEKTDLGHAPCQQGPRPNQRTGTGRVPGTKRRG